jgi:multimeric flavodoxin WrbA
VTFESLFSIGEEMKVTAINGSPKGIRSNTYVMQKALLDGFQQNGDNVSIINLSEKKIEYCSGCYSCWSKTPGVCIHNDDMADIRKNITNSNVIILGTPLFFNNISGTLKVFFDRLTAAGGDPHNKGDNNPNKVNPMYIMVSNCGYPVRNQFDIVSLWIKKIVSMMQTRLIAEFYTTSGKVLTSPTNEQIKSREKYIEYLVNCGKNLSKNSKLEKENEDLLGKNILDF